MKMLKAVAFENPLRCSRGVPQKANKKKTKKTKPFVAHIDIDNNKKTSNDEYQQQNEQPESPSFSSTSSFFFPTKYKSKARLRAEEEEEKLLKEQAERAQKLQKFQTDVQKRVSVLHKMKQQKEIEREIIDVTIARNVMRSCVGLSTSVINPKKFLVSAKSPSSLPDDVTPNNSLLSQNQDLPSTCLHNSSSNQQQPIEEVVSHWVPNTDISPYSGPVKIICDNKPSSNIKYPITGGMKDRKKHNRLPDNPCFGNSKDHAVPRVNSDKRELLEMKKQQTLQRTLSRKVFMDMERENAREVERQNQQRMELFLLRNTREAIRKKVENSARQPLVHSATEVYEEYEIPVIIEKPKDKSPKHSLHKISYTRKLIALMQLLEEKCNKLCIPVPSLCPCSTNPTDPLRNNCANNCQFYRNPAEYCRAINCLISSMESRKHPRPFLT